MKALLAAAAVGITLIGAAGSASAQYGGGYGGGGYGGGGYGGGGYGERDRGYSDRRRGGGFDEDEYLRCNPDVRRAVNRGTMESGLVHYQTFGRKERRRLSC